MLQGLGDMQVRPILCFANCEPIQGASRAWAIAGVRQVARLLEFVAGAAWGSDVPASPQRLRSLG